MLDVALAMALWALAAFGPRGVLSDTAGKPGDPEPRHLDSSPSPATCELHDAGHVS